MQPSISLCYQNHLSISSNAYHSTAKSRQFELSWSPCRSQPLDFKSECLRAVQLLSEETHKELIVAMSGGIDCEIVARCLLEMQIPFRALSYSFHGGSDHDLRWARSFCKQHSIPHEVISFDEDQFIRETLPTLAEEFFCPDPYPLFEIERFRRVSESAFPIFGNGEPCLTAELSSQNLTLSESSSDFVVWSWQMSRQRSGCYNFFKYTPELFASYLLDPVSQAWIEQASRLNLRELAQWKYYLYKRHWPDIEKRQKWTGYERIGAAYMKAQKQLRDRFSYESDFDRREYSQFIRFLLGAA